MNAFFVNTAKNSGKIYDMKLRLCAKINIVFSAVTVAFAVLTKS